MPHPRYASDEISRIGRELYQRQIRSQVETEENIGKIVSIDIETGDYEVDDDLLKAAKRLQARHPDAALWGERIGYDAVYGVGGSVERTTE
jgi:hypothetical protein